MKKYLNRIRKILCGSIIFVSLAFVFYCVYEISNEGNITDNIKGLAFLIVAVIAYIAGGFN